MKGELKRLLVLVAVFGLLAARGASPQPDPYWGLNSAYGGDREGVYTVEGGTSPSIVSSGTVTAFGEFSYFVPIKGYSVSFANPTSASWSDGNYEYTAQGSPTIDVGSTKVSAEGRGYLQVTYTVTVQATPIGTADPERRTYFVVYDDTGEPIVYFDSESQARELVGDEIVDALISDGVARESTIPEGEYFCSGGWC